VAGKLKDLIQNIMSFETFTYKRNACAWHCKVGLFRNFDDEDDNHVLLPQHPVR
jgi:hypothetical protein